jgi:hypothetical protein
MFGLILLIVSLLLFVLAALNLPSPRVNLVATGLAFYVASILIGRFIP